MYNFKHVEEEVTKLWNKNKIFEKLRKKIKGNKPWSFIDGPITANNPMGVHHAYGRTYKDLYQRFKAMQGFDQRFQNGFDCQGLWLEVETEKDLGFNSKKDIEDFGLDKFSKACRARVNKFSKIQTEQSIKLGQWMDWDNSYYTMSDKNIEYIWNFLKKCHEKRWLYKGTKVLPWCIRCGTSSSQHEMSDAGYADLVHKSVYVKFKIKNKKNEYFLVWTTTEWTLSSNVALAVNPSLNYAKVKINSNIFYLAEKTLHKLGMKPKVLGIVKGKKLIGLEYESIYPEIGFQKNVKHKVVGWDEVGEEEGTGIVHIAPTCGVEDHELSKKENLAIISPALDEAGNFNDGFDWLTGKNVMKVKNKIIEDLDKKGFLYKTEDYKHRYPICWRCGTELVFRFGSEWFISCNEIRPLMKKAVSKINWQPEHVGKLMQDWLDNMGDWNISRKRFWGLPLMFFECKCGHIEVIGSLKELRKKAVDKKVVDSLPELHRPWIDKVKIKCSKCNQIVERIKEVGDCWLDAGIVPFSTLKYFEDRKYWEKWFPADLVIEMRAQVRLWFYSLLFMAITLENKSPYKSVLAYESVVDENGEEMHKSKGNAIVFDEAVEKMGADVMRWMYCYQNTKMPLRFGYSIAKEVHKLLTVIWNIGNYVKLYCKNVPKSVKNLKIEDKWIISKTESLKKKVTESLDKLQPNLAIREIETFLINNLSREYGQFVRDRLDDKNAQNVLYNCFLDGLKMLAPFTPFITEYIHQNLTKRQGYESIHLNGWPLADRRKIDLGLELRMTHVKQVIQGILAERSDKKIGIRWPLAEITILTKNDAILKSVKNLEVLIKKQVNCKKLLIKKQAIEEEFEITLNTELTSALEKEGYTREVIRRIQDLRKKAKLNKKDKIELYLFSKVDLDFNLIKKITNAKLVKKLTKAEYADKFKVREKEFLIGFNKI